MMNLSDNTPFQLGMTVVFNNAREIVTDDSYGVDEDGILHKKDGCGGIDLKCLFSSQQSRINFQVGQLEIMKKVIDDEIEFIKNGGNPSDCFFLHLNSK